MVEVAVLLMLILITIFRGGYVATIFAQRSKYQHQKPERDVEDGCAGYLIAGGVLLFVIVSLIFQDQLLDAVGRKFVE